MLLTISVHPADLAVTTPAIPSKQCVFKKGEDQQDAPFPSWL